MLDDLEAAADVIADVGAFGTIHGGADADVDGGVANEVLVLLDISWGVYVV